MNLPVYGADANSIMPLQVTRCEIDETAERLFSLESSWNALFAATIINTQVLSDLILVGSGDSWTAALTAAVYLEQRTTLRCRVLQTYDFLQSNLHRYGQETLIVMISASGRPSPVLDAINYALTSSAQVIGITNGPGSPFSKTTPNMLFTQAQKKGFPTQSTSATLYLLLRLADALSTNSDSVTWLTTQPESQFSTIKKAWQSKDLDFYRKNKLIFLGSNLSWGMALSGMNLLSSGPQIHADAFLIEEFYHSLRLNQVSEGHHFILLPATLADANFYHATYQSLLKKGATAEIVDYLDNSENPLHIFLRMQWLYEMSWNLACDFIKRGGQRVTC